MSFMVGLRFGVWLAGRGWLRRLAGSRVMGFPFAQLLFLLPFGLAGLIQFVLLFQIIVCHNVVCMFIR